MITVKNNLKLGKKERQETNTNSWEIQRERIKE